MARRHIAVLVQAALCTLAAGCTTVVAGSAMPADTSGPLPHTPVAVAALDGLLLGADTINSVLSAGMRLRDSATAMWDASPIFSDKNCLAMDGPAQEAVYADSGWTAMRGQRFDDSFDDPRVRNASAAEAVIAYPSARQANAFYDASVRRWFACADLFAVLTKEVVARLGDGVGALTRTPELYACILVALGGVAWSQSAFRAGPLTASMPTLQMSQPVVAAVLGVVVLGEALDTGRTGMIALVAAALVMTAAIIKLARVEAVATRDGVEARRHEEAGQPA